jgi:hypothetical protein
VVLYRCGTWSLTLREERRLRLFENWVLSRIFGPNRKELTREWRKLHVARNAYRLLVGKPEGRRPLGRPRRRWLDNIMMDLLEVEWGDVDWIGLAQDRDRWRALGNSVLNLRVP